jgi:Mg-chelatase subunit ChlD
MFVRAGRWTSLVVVAIAAGCGSSTPGSHGAAGTSGHAGSRGAAGAVGAAGTTATAGNSGGAGTSATAGASGDAGAGGSGGNAGGAGAGGTAGTAGAAGAGASDAGADAPVATMDGGGADSPCGPMRLDRVAPDLLLLLDRSGSMSNQLDGTICPRGGLCETRWGDCTMAVNQVVQETETSVRWGLKFFPTNASCGVTDIVSVPVGTSNAGAIAQAIAGTMPGGSTPTRLAIASAAAYLTGLADPNPKVLLLATDGLPNCLPGAPNTATDDSAGTIAAVKLVADSGIPVYVIGIGSDVMNQINLEQIAIAGGRPRATSPAFYPAESTADLVDVLRAIGAQSMPCTYALPAVPPDPAHAVVSAAQVRIPRDPTHAEGWDYGDMSKTIRLYGTWCTKDQAGMLADVELLATCSP